MLTTVDAARDKAAKQKRDEDEPILEQARKRMRASDQAEGRVKARMLEDLKFSANLTGTEQWDPRAVTMRKKEERPRFTIDRLSQPIYSLANQARESGSRLQVHPVDEGADQETAEIIQGVTRNIENQSRANLAYIWGREGAIRMGRGYVRIVPEYVNHPNRKQLEAELDPKLFEQDLRIKRVRNPLAVYRDPSAEEPDYSDARYYFITADPTVDEYVAEYGDVSQVGGLEDLAGIGDHKAFWAPGGHIRVAEYYRIESEYEDLLLLRDNAGNPLAVLKSKVDALRTRLAAQGRFVAPDVELTRRLEIRQIKWCKMNGVEIISRLDVPGRWIPIIPIIGEELFVDGEYDVRGIVRGAKEATSAYNFQVTGLIEAVNLMPKAPFLIAAGQIKGFEDVWANANIENYAYLPYNEVSVGGQLVGAPQRNPAMPPIQPLVSAILQMDNDIKAATRYFDASLGKSGPDQSGIAIRARQQQGATATSHFDANFRDVSLTHIGRILVDNLPYYYDAERVARIIGQDEQPKTVTLNKPFVDEQGVERLYQFGVGQYDVTVTGEPGYGTKLQEDRDLVASVLEKNPAMWPIIGDLAFKKLGLHDIAKRLEKALDPGLKDETGPGGQPPIPPEVQQQMEMMKQQLDQVMQALEEAKRDLDAQTAKAQAAAAVSQAQIASDERVAGMKAQADAARVTREADVDLAEIKSRELIAQLQIEQKNQAVAIEAKLEELKLLFQEQQAARAAERADEQRLHGAMREDRHREEDREAAQP